MKMKAYPVLKFCACFTAVGERAFNLLHKPGTDSKRTLLFYFHTFSNYPSLFEPKVKTVTSGEKCCQNCRIYRYSILFNSFMAGLVSLIFLFFFLFISLSESKVP